MSRAERRRQARDARKSQTGKQNLANNPLTGQRAQLAQMLEQATLYLETGAYQLASSIIDGMLKIDPDHAGALAQKGTLHYLHGDFRTAVACYQRSVEIDGSNARILYNLGAVLTDDGRRPEAVAPLKKAIALEPSYGEAHNALGFALIADWCFEEAKRHFLVALKRLGADPIVYANLGLCHAGTGDIDTALTFFTKALQLAPGDTRAFDGVKYAVAGLALSEDKKAQEIWAELRGSLQAAIPRQLVLIENDLGRLKASPAPDLLASVQAALPPLVDEVEPLASPQVGIVGSDASEPPSRMCALLHFGRSATGLLHSLMDGHPEVTTLPGVYFKGFFGSGVWDRIRNSDPQVLIDRFSEIYEVLFDATSPKLVPGNSSMRTAGVGHQDGMTRLGDNKKEVLNLDKSAFQRHLSELLSGRERLDQGDFFLMLHRAFERAQGKPGNEDLAFYHIHNPNSYEFANFLRYFPNARIMMMAREPIQNCESWVTRDVIEVPSYNALVFKLGQLLTDIVRPEFEHRDAFGIKLDDLKLKPEATMRAFATRLGIKWNPCLLEPTMQGLTWWGDPTSKTFGLDPFDPGVLKRKVGKVFSERDQSLLRTLFYPFRVLYGWQEREGDEFQKFVAEAPKILDQPLGCEKTLVAKAGLPLDKLEHHTSYKYLRLVLGLRLKALEKYGTYPGMIPPLDVAG